MMLRTVLVLAALAAVAVAQPPPRPNLPATFVANVNVEQHSNNEHFFGDGKWAVDYANQKSVENYILKGTRHEIIPLFLFDLQRFDQGQSYSIASQDFNECRVREIQGPMPKPFSWIANATYIGKDLFHHVEVDLWGIRYGSVALEVGVQAPKYNVPFFYRRFSNGQEFFVEFRDFQTPSTIDQRIFDVPVPCQGFRQVIKATAPKRPVISNTFDADMTVEMYANQRRLDGNAHWSSDHSGTGKDMEVQFLHDDQRRQDMRSFRLNRYDLKTSYFVDDVNRTRCQKDALTGSQPGLWDWITQATYIGQRQERFGTVDLWQFLPGGGVNLTLGVLDRNVNTPVYFHRVTPDADARYFFQRWDTRVVDPRVFTVPPECN